MDALLLPFMLIKIVNHLRGSQEIIPLANAAGQLCPFVWDDRVGAYVYDAKSQVEVDELISLNYRHLQFPHKLSPVFGGLAPQPAANGNKPSEPGAQVRIPPYFERKHYLAYPAADLVMLAKMDCGFDPVGDPTDRESLLLQLDCYYKGRAWGAVEVKRMKTENAALTAENAALKAKLPKPVVRRVRKERELQPA